MTHCADAIDVILKPEDDGLRKISDFIRENPELGFEEHKAHACLADYLESKGFRTDRHFLLPTAFRATYDSGRPGNTVAFMSEYDALPEIGHACGHNLIAMVGVAAGLCVSHMMRAENSTLSGKVVILGTPAEEGGGGKLEMIKGGAFDDVDVAMMSHPAPLHAGYVNALSNTRATVVFRGRAAHAAAFPHNGVNALDAAVLAYSGIAALRQQLKRDSAVQVVISKGGTKSNVIPDHAEILCQMHSSNVSELVVLQEKVNNCFKAAATSTGCSVEITYSDKCYYSVLTNPTMIDMYMASCEKRGIQCAATNDIPFSTDMGNVSFRVPAIHPVFSIGRGDCYNHSKEFTALCGTDESHSAAVVSAKCLAEVAGEMLSNPQLVEKAKSELRLDQRRQVPDVFVGTLKFNETSNY